MNDERELLKKVMLWVNEANFCLDNILPEFEGENEERNFHRAIGLLGKTEITLSRYFDRLEEEMEEEQN